LDFFDKNKNYFSPHGSCPAATPINGNDEGRY
jgi:hypothetical protein